MTIPARRCGRPATRKRSHGLQPDTTNGHPPAYSGDRTRESRHPAAASQSAAALERWLRDVQAGFEDRVLPVTLPVAAAWGRQQYAQPRPVIDELIAATARVRGLTLVTRNVKDFELAGVQVLNPFTE